MRSKVSLLFLSEFFESAMEILDRRDGGKYNEKCSVKILKILNIMAKFKRV